TVVDWRHDFAETRLFLAQRLGLVRILGPNLAAREFGVYFFDTLFLFSVVKDTPEGRPAAHAVFPSEISGHQYPCVIQRQNGSSARMIAGQRRYDKRRMRRPASACAA